MFSRGKFSKVSVWRADHHCDLFSSQTLGELKFIAGDRCCFFGQKCDEETVGQAEGQMGGWMLLHLAKVFVFLKEIDSYSYYITFVWSCNVTLWDISLYLVE